MKYKSQVYTEASGSIGGVTYSHNRGGLYTRARCVPSNPNSPGQQLVRAAVANLVNQWNTTLTPAQRTGWATYAENVLMQNALGAWVNIGAVAHFVRCNVPRIQGGFSLALDAPGIFNLGQFTAPVVTAVTAATDQFTFTLTAGDEWNVANGGLCVYSSRGRSVGTNYFKGPYRIATSLEGPGVGTPQNKELAFAVAAGQRVFFQFRFLQGDGRLSLPYQTFFLAS